MKNKTMKVIDLLIKIALKKYDQLPKVVKYCDEKYIWCKVALMYTSDGTIEGEGMLNDVFIERVLNDEVEILEEKPKQIEPLNPISLEEFKTMNPTERYHATIVEYDKIEELRNAVNYLLEKSDNND